MIYRRTPLHYAIDGNRFGCFKILLENGADPNIPDKLVWYTIKIKHLLLNQWV